MAKPMKTLELHYPMIQFLIIVISNASISNIRPRALPFCNSCFRQALGPPGRLESLVRRLLGFSCHLRIQALQRGQSVNVYLFPCPFRCISWSIVALLDFLPLVYVFMLCNGYFSFGLWCC